MTSGRLLEEIHELFYAWLGNEVTTKQFSYRMIALLAPNDPEATCKADQIHGSVYEFDSQGCRVCSWCKGLYAPSK